jgi:hypothetical protein
MRAGSLAFRSALPLLVLACGGDDLLLPSSGAPASLRLVSGDLQQGLTGIMLPEPLVVEALDRTGRPVEGSRILFRFQAATEGAQVSPDTAVTNAEGQAEAEVRLGQAPGGHPVEAIVVNGDLDLAVRFLLTALTRPAPPDPPDGGDGDGGGAGGGGDDDDGDDGGDDGGSGNGNVDDGGGKDNDDGGRPGEGKDKEKGKDKGKGKGDKHKH